MTLERHHYQIQFAVTGRLRFLSHLETVDTLLSAVRRTGVAFAMSQGFKPKPIIKVAMPRPVAVASAADIVEVALTHHIDPDDFRARLEPFFPTGLELVQIDKLAGKYDSAASRVIGATWRAELDPTIDVPALEDAVASFMRSDEHIVRRDTPRKKSKDVDVRRATSAAAVSQSDGQVALAFSTVLNEHGSAKPTEVVTAICTIAGVVPHITLLTRESILLAESSEEGHIATPALVGAEVPADPEKPWGAC